MGALEQKDPGFRSSQQTTHTKENDDGEDVKFVTLRLNSRRHPDRKTENTSRASEKLGMNMHTRVAIHLVSFYFIPRVIMAMFLLSPSTTLFVTLSSSTK